MSRSLPVFDLFFTPFEQDISSYTLPEKFTFPFCYEPHELAKIASQELQEYLESQSDWEHNFGLDKNQKGLIIGKMFGILVVRNSAHQLGYLSACSGKLAGTNKHRKFVPPVFDMLQKDSFFLQEEEYINALNRQIELLEKTSSIPQWKERLEHLAAEAGQAISAKKTANKKRKEQRKKNREEAINLLNPAALAEFSADLIKQSLRDKHQLNTLSEDWKKQMALLSDQINTEEEKINKVKESRRQKSAALQQKLFDQYYFLNARGERKNIAHIFQDFLGQHPPAGAGECAAPKLLHYAYSQEYTPIALAEFWWGQAPSSEVRIHKNYYPACKNKCEPILDFMLRGLEVQDNPMLKNPAENQTLAIIYEDEAIIVVNKPAELLSVPGIHIKDSVYTRIAALYPTATGPLIIHRLDMSTSGILVLAKTKYAHQYMQAQFINRSIQKTYIALLEGLVYADKGTIALPLRVDLEDRPRQLVCHTHGRKALTEFEVLQRSNGRTKIKFHPITGRTHQLRVHAAHHLGLAAPIVGDDLYGSKDIRLHLHAASITFKHPLTQEIISFTVCEEF